MDDYQTKLKEYLPDFIYSIDDIRKASEAIDTQIKKVWEAIGRAYSNAFIDTADETGIKVYEKTLGIMPTPDETLEERRANAKMLWNFSIPFTENYLMEYLGGIYGEDGYTYSKDATKCEVYVTVDSYDEAQNARVKRVLRHMIPAHEWLSFIASIPRDAFYHLTASVFTYTESEENPPIHEGYNEVSEINAAGYPAVVQYDVPESEVKE